MNSVDFQTPPEVCRYMASFLPDSAGSILEPTPGAGNLVSAIQHKGDITTPGDFFLMPFQRFDWIVMNPPFTPMATGYRILNDCMGMSDNIIALMPWLTLINGEKRTRQLINFGLKSVTHLPRSIFKGSRVQCCVMELRKGYRGKTELLNYDKQE